MTPSFAQTLRQAGLSLTRGRAETLQINVGLVCNQACKHCHLEAGPARAEQMDLATMRQAASYARRCGFAQADVTGGAPELHPHLPELLDLLAEAAPRVMLRANLTALAGREALWELLPALGVVVVASFPSLSQAQAEAQRGDGVFQASLAALRRLNGLGYGQPGGLELNLVSNPAGAFLPPDQAKAEQRFRRELRRRWGVEFNNLFTFANAPLGRFGDWLRAKKNYDAYLGKLSGAFNPCALEGVMCRGLVSVGWDGCLYDCDFNLAAGLPLGGRRTHVSQMDGPPPEGSPIAVGDHCYTCTAGAGFT